MAKQKIDTEAEKADWWLRRAAEYDREAAKARNPNNKQVWEQRAADARQVSQQHLPPPASSEAQTA